MIGEAGYEQIDPDDFDRNTAYSDEGISSSWQRVKGIVENGQMCKEMGQDENAWCDEVVRPLFSLVIDLEGSGKWCIKNVQMLSFL